MADSRTDLATAVNAVADLSPSSLDGGILVERLCADPAGRAALIALGRELATEQFREASRKFAAAFAELADTLGFHKPAAPEDDEAEAPAETDTPGDTRRTKLIKDYVKDRTGDGGS